MWLLSNIIVDVFMGEEDSSPESSSRVESNILAVKQFWNDITSHVEEETMWKASDMIKVKGQYIYNTCQQGRYARTLKAGNAKKEEKVKK